MYLFPMFQLYLTLLLFLIVSWHLVKKYEQAYILSVPDVMDVLTSLITTTIDMVSSKYVSIVLDVTIVLKSSQLFLKRIWWICSSCTWCASVPHSIIMNRLLSVFFVLWLICSCCTSCYYCSRWSDNNYDYITLNWFGLHIFS